MAGTPYSLRAPSRSSTSVDWQALLMSLLLGIVALLVIMPLLMMLVSSFELARPGLPEVYGLAGWQRAFSDPLMLSAIWNTVSLSVIREGIALIVGIFLAWLFARTDLPGRKGLEFLFWIAFFLPPLPVAMGWILLFDGRRGMVNDLLHYLPLLPSPLFNIYGYWGLIWAHMGQSIGAKVLLLTPAFQNLDASLEEAAWTSGEKVLHTLRRIIVPLMVPAIVVTTILGVIRSLDAFEVELLLGVPIRLYVYSTRIRDLITSGSPDYATASALGTMFLVALLLLVAAQRRLVGKRSYRTVTGRSFSSRTLTLRGWRWPAFSGTLVLAGVVTVLPVAVLVMGTFMTVFGHFDLPQVWTLNNWREVLTDPLLLGSFRNTLLVGLGAGLIGPLFYALAAYVILKTRFLGRAALDFLSWLPWAVPGILTGLALLWTIFKIPLLRPLYGTVAVLVLALVIKTMPLGVQLGKSVLMQFGDELEEACRTAGATWGQAMRRVVLPLLTPTLVTIGVVGFMSAARDISSVVLLGSSQSQTLALLSLNFAVSSQLEKATVVAVMTVALVALAAALARYVGGGLSLGSGHSS